jgi:predicted phage-related endonuclease
MNDMSLMLGRCSYIGGSDARTIMGDDEEALIRLWREKRGEIAPEDLSGNLIVQLGITTEDLNRRWFERETGHRLARAQTFLRHPRLDWMGATLDGLIVEESAVFEAKFMLPWSFSEASAAEKHMPQLQHNMLVSGAPRAYLSIVTGGGKWVSIEVDADPVYQTVLLQVERSFWRCVKSGDMPSICGAEPPRAKLPMVRIVDMSASNAWGEHATIFARTLTAHGQHEAAKAELKLLIPEDAKVAFGHGVKARRSKTGAISIDVIADGGEHASRQ